MSPSERLPDNSARAPIDLERRFFALHGRIGKEGLAALSRQKGLPKLERGLLSLMASVSGAYEGADGVVTMLGKTCELRHNYKFQGAPVEDSSPSTLPKPAEAEAAGEDEQ